MIPSFLFVCLLCLAANVEASCVDTLSSFCINQDDFHMGVAHGIHSMTLQELQYFFDADATEDNKIPMINFNLSSPDLVLPSIPDLKLNNSFLTPSMNSVDHILSNWETEDFIMKNASVLELLVHNLHMFETLSLAGKIYKKIKRDQRKRNAKNMNNLCNCINGTEQKIMDELELTAKRFRETDSTNRKHWRAYYGYWWTCRCQIKAPSRPNKERQAPSTLPDHCPG